MLDLLQFIFSGFWTFVGTFCLLSTTLNGVADVIRAIRD